MTRVTKNYTENGGDKTVIGGTLEINAGAEVTGLPQGVAVPDSVATTIAGLVVDYNTLLASLRTAGIIASE